MQKLINKPTKAWHFIDIWKHTFSGYPRNLEVKEGKTLYHKKDLELCRSGLHASIKLIDAFRYVSTRDCLLTRVEVNHYINGNDKLVAKQRKCLKIFSNIETINILREIVNWMQKNKEFNDIFNENDSFGRISFVLNDILYKDHSNKTKNLRRRFQRFLNKLLNYYLIRKV